MSEIEKYSSLSESITDSEDLLNKMKMIGCDVPDIDLMRMAIIAHANKIPTEQILRILQFSKLRQERTSGSLNSVIESIIHTLR